MKTSGWILTYTGRRFWPLEPSAADVRVEDIAHALAMKCRFSGHTREFYSVAQHAVLCSEYVECYGGGADAQLQLAALMHDAGEAYLPDVVKPIKQALGFESFAPNGSVIFRGSFNAAEEQILQAIGSALDFEPRLCAHPLVTEADEVMLMTERRDLMPNSPYPWAVKPVRLWDKIVPCGPGWAREVFLARYRRLDGMLRRSRAALEHIAHRTIGSEGGLS